ncbi:hypothetical protein [Actinoallomurus sp. NPDC052274]|uniref:hypothetical protein n=1 Tax=Actinoallomurus sp. NPDC052274 TaxID=3155420 RepID=UPI00341C4926
MTNRHERILNIGALARVEGEDALATARWVAGFDFPALTFDHELLALAGGECALERGTPRTTTGAAFEAAADAGLGTRCRNPFPSIVVRAVEVVHAIEEDLRRLVRDRLDLDDEALTSACERTIRSYDPCVSRTAHFVDLKVVRS